MLLMNAHLPTKGMSLGSQSRMCNGYLTQTCARHSELRSDADIRRRIACDDGDYVYFYNLVGCLMPISITRAQEQLPRRFVTLILAVVLIMTLALPADAASATVTFSNTCKVKIENGSGWLWQNPWARTTEIENCAQLRTSLRYWNGTQYTWIHSNPLWQSKSVVEVSVSNVTDYERSQHGGRNVSGSGGRCIQMTKSGSLTSFFDC